MKDRFIPLFVLDPYTVSKHKDPISVIEHLASRTEDPRWSRELACYHCETWQPEHGLMKQPWRPGRGTTAVDGCSGCWYAMLDVAPDRNHDVATSIRLRGEWLKALMPRPPRKTKRYTRLLRHDTVKPGFAGKKDERPKSSSAFRLPHRLPEKTPCPKCSLPSKMERVHMLGGNQPGESKLPPEPWIYIRCASCGTTKIREEDMGGL